MKIILAIIISLTLLSCAKVKPLDKATIVENFDQFIAKQSQYVKDSSTDVFEESPWYSYDEPNHIIWPTFSVYSIRSNGNYYKVQMINYYDTQANPGVFTLRVAKDGQSSKVYSFEAQGCGNVYTNPNFESCLLNPETNIYTYLNLSNGNTFKTTDAQAKKRSDWDVAFNGTTIRTNAGKYGSKGTRAANVFIYRSFFPRGIVDYQRIAEVSFSDKGERFFNLDMDIRNIPFALPPGVNRVINEPDWFKNSSTTDGLFEAVNKNWWIVRSAESNSYTKLNIDKIVETIDLDNKIDTDIHFKTYHQSITDDAFDTTEMSWKLDTINSSKRLIKICIDLDKRAKVSCNSSIKTWDIKLTILNRKKRRWKIDTANGAIGPLLLEDILKRTSGRE
ncbi:MAG: hypothetical protein BM556_12180 [Bacteriovorax sp. MedPE-SWde]|nr:MAG: hypothetical protein BM556_12180 [Bacteriovorax sp. MedPE-SWde]